MLIVGDVMFNLDDYYLGVILASPSYYNIGKSQKRIKSYPDADPFYGFSRAQAMIMGQVVLLKKEGISYSDYDNSLYKNELMYNLGKVNSYGIVLSYVRKFTDYFSKDCSTYSYERALDNPFLLENMVLEDYYVMRSTLTREDAVVINNLEIKEQVRTDYLKKLFSDNNIDIKKFVKK